MISQSRNELPYYAVDTEFLRIEVAPEYRPAPIRIRIKSEIFILKAMAYIISSDKGREITMGKDLQAAACIRRNTVRGAIFV